LKLLSITKVMGFVPVAELGLILHRFQHLLDLHLPQVLTLMPFLLSHCFR
jgi:hypothetical protein